MAHKIDYKNAVFDKRKWVITENEDGTYTIEDATAYEQEGDVIGADYFNEMGAAMNEAENGIAQAVPKSYVISSADDLAALTESGFLPDAMLVQQLNKNMGGLCFGVDGDGNYGYYRADGSLVPFKMGTMVCKSSSDNTGSIPAFTIRAKKVYVALSQYTTYDIGKYSCNTAANVTILFNKEAMQTEVGFLKTVFYLYESNDETDFTISVSAGHVSGVTNSQMLVAYE